MLLVSACLAGVNCKYNGQNNLHPKVLDLVKEGKAILVCPEQLGGLTTPRNPAEIVVKDGIIKVINNKGQDVTKEYERGAQETLALAQNLKIDKAIFKAHSPSCGCGFIYDGTFTHTKIKGNGITTDLLIRNGIEVMTEEQL